MGYVIRREEVDASVDQTKPSIQIIIILPRAHEPNAKMESHRHYYSFYN